MSFWQDDLLNFEETGASFTNLVSTIDAGKVISIEAGFGHGKTFFRKAWAKQLEANDEVVIELDAQLSDHSGDPVITFMGALAERLGPKKRPDLETAMAVVTKYGGMASRSLMRAALRSGAEELIEAFELKAGDQVEGVAILEDIVKDTGEGLSKFASQLISTQLATEQVRKTELPQQLEVLRKALTEGKPHDRVVVLIDELDRCHPEYAIAMLEALKMVFGHSNFVFCLFVNAEYLENLAAHRFGQSAKGERYLDKFVDLRLALTATPEARKAATKALALEQFDVGTPLGDKRAFSAGAAAELAGEIVSQSDLTFRQVKRVLDRVELALRCYPRLPLDRPLLVFLAFRDVLGEVSSDLLPRSRLTTEKAEELKEIDNYSSHHEQSKRDNFIRENCLDLQNLDPDIYQMPSPPRGPTWLPLAQVISGLGPIYIPRHEKVLKATHALIATEAK